MRSGHRNSLARDAGPAYVVGLAAGLAILLASGSLEIALAHGLTSDLSYIWAGPRAVLDGYDPYDPSQWRAAVEARGTQGFTSPAVYSYPPAVLLVLLPFGLLPLAAAFVIWAVVPPLSAALAVRALLHEAMPAARWFHGLAGLALVLSQPAVVTLRIGQWSYVLLAALAAAIVLTRRGRPIAGAVATAVLLVKVHLMLITFPALAIAVPRRDRARYVAALAAAAACPVVLTAVARPGWWASWWSHVPLARATEPNVTTVWRVLTDAVGIVGPILAVGLAALALLAIVRVRDDPVAVVALGVAASLAFAPYMRSYDHLIAIAPITMAGALLARRNARAADLVGGAMLAGFIAGTWTLIYAVGEPRRSESLSWLVPCAVLVLVLAAARIGRGAPGRTP